MQRRRRWPSCCTAPDCQVGGGLGCCAACAGCAARSAALPSRPARPWGGALGVGRWLGPACANWICGKQSTRLCPPLCQCWACAPLLPPLAVWECWRLWGEVAHSQDSAAVRQLPLGIQVRVAAPVLPCTPPLQPDPARSRRVALARVAACLEAVQHSQAAVIPARVCRIHTRRCATCAAWMPPPCSACWGRPWMAGMRWRQVQAAGVLGWRYTGPGAGWYCAKLFSRDAGMRLGQHRA